MAFLGELVNGMARQTPFVGNALGAFALMDQFMALEQLGVELFETVDRTAQADVQEHRHAAHALDAAADDIVHVPGGNRLRREMHGLLARSAHAVEGHAGHFDRQLRQQHGQPSRVCALFSCERDGAVNHIPDLARIGARALQQAVYDMREQCIGAIFAQRAAPPAKRRPDGSYYDGFVHVIS